MFRSRKFYAFHYASGPNTTSGSANPSTGRYNIAGELAVFSSQMMRDAYVEIGKETLDMEGNSHRAITREQARNHCLGMTMSEYNDYVRYLIEQYPFR